MTPDTFARVLDAVRACDLVPSVFFGGFGEPLAHPRIATMIAGTRAAGADVELITNARCSPGGGRTT